MLEHSIGEPSVSAAEPAVVAPLRRTIAKDDVGTLRGLTEEEQLLLLVFRLAKRQSLGSLSLLEHKFLAGAADVFQQLADDCRGTTTRARKADAKPKDAPSRSKSGGKELADDRSD